MFDRNILIEQTDPELFAAIQAENTRQEHHIELIASENYASPAPAPWKVACAITWGPPTLRTMAATQTR
jgi:hypothetical protein